MNTFIKIFYGSSALDVQVKANEYAKSQKLDMISCTLSHDTNRAEFTYEKEENFYLCVIFKCKENKNEIFR